MYLLAVLSLHYCAWASHHSGLSCCRTQASCSAARGIFLDQVSNLRPLHWQADSHMLSHQGCLLFPFLMKLLTGTHLI